MSGYINKASLCFKHKPPEKKQNTPCPHVIPTYGAKIQYTELEDDAPMLNNEDTRFIQHVTGTLLY
jgi:hypothetical protein